MFRAFWPPALLAVLLTSMVSCIDDRGATLDGLDPDAATPLCPTPPCLADRGADMELPDAALIDAARVDMQVPDMTPDAAPDMARAPDEGVPCEPGELESPELGELVAAVADGTRLRLDRVCGDDVGDCRELSYAVGPDVFIETPMQFTHERYAHRLGGCHGDRGWWICQSVRWWMFNQTARGGFMALLTLNGLGAGGEEDPVLYDESGRGTFIPHYPTNQRDDGWVNLSSDHRRSDTSGLVVRGVAFPNDPRGEHMRRDVRFSVSYNTTEHHVEIWQVIDGGYPLPGGLDFPFFQTMVINAQSFSDAQSDPAEELLELKAAWDEPRQRIVLVGRYRAEGGPDSRTPREVLFVHAVDPFAMPVQMEAIGARTRMNLGEEGAASPDNERLILRRDASGAVRIFVRRGFGGEELLLPNAGEDPQEAQPLRTRAFPVADPNDVDIHLEDVAIDAGGRTHLAYLLKSRNGGAIRAVLTRAEVNGTLSLHTPLFEPEEGACPEATWRPTTMRLGVIRDGEEDDALRGLVHVALRLEVAGAPSTAEIRSLALRINGDYEVLPPPGE